MAFKPLMPGTDKPELRGRELDVDGSFNVRDLGGYPVQGGGTTKSGRFLRAGSLHSITREGRRLLLDLGVRRVIDLRSRHEVGAKPDAVSDDPDFNWYHVPMLDYINSSVAAGEITFPGSLEEMYIGLVEDTAPSFARVFELFADSGDDGCLFHCTAGKDRTGIVAMLLLGLAGVDEEIIVEDYSISESRVPFMIPLPGVPDFLIKSPPEVMRAVLEHIRLKWGGVRGYLTAIGVTPLRLAAVEEKLLG